MYSSFSGLPSVLLALLLALRFPGEKATAPPAAAHGGIGPGAQPPSVPPPPKETQLWGTGPGRGLGAKVPLQATRLWQRRGGT